MSNEVGEIVMKNMDIEELVTDKTRCSPGKKSGKETTMKKHCGMENCTSWLCVL